MKFTPIRKGAAKNARKPNPATRKALSDAMARRTAEEDVADKYRSSVRSAAGYRKGKS